MWKRARIDVAKKHDVCVGIEKIFIVHVHAHVLDDGRQQKGNIKPQVGAAHKVCIAGLQVASLFGGAELVVNGKVMKHDEPAHGFKPGGQGGSGAIVDEDRHEAGCIAGREQGHL